MYRQDNLKVRKESDSDEKEDIPFGVISDLPHVIHFCRFDLASFSSCFCIKADAVTDLIISRGFGFVSLTSLLCCRVSAIDFFRDSLCCSKLLISSFVDSMIGLLSTAEWPSRSLVSIWSKLDLDFPERETGACFVVFKRLVISFRNWAQVMSVIAAIKTAPVCGAVRICSAR